MCQNLYTMYKKITLISLTFTQGFVQISLNTLNQLLELNNNFNYSRSERKKKNRTPLLIPIQIIVEKQNLDQHGLLYIIL